MQGQRAGILIVDDVYINTQLALRLIESDHYVIQAATSGEEALQIVGAGGIDLILLDIMMPGIDGFELCRRLKADPKTSDIPIIFLSGKSDEDSVVEGFELGAVDYVTKPFRAAELRARVRTHIDLRMTQKELKESNRERERFFSIIAHDLRSPFTALLGMSQFLREGIGDLDAETAKELVGGIYTASKTAFHLLENLLQLARLQTGSVKLSTGKVGVSSAVQDALDGFSHTIETRGVELLQEHEENLYASIDERAMVIVLRNLISNAIKFSREGGTVRIHSRREGDRVQISIRDQGIGMDEETKMHLFHLDHRKRKRADDEAQGSGLGLILVKSFLDRSGGELSYSSSLGAGSEFVVQVPIWKQE